MALTLVKTKFTPQLFLLVLPFTYFGLSLIMREHAGPFWLWSNLDPDYAYLFDSLNLLNGEWPKEMAHPGITVDLIGAVVIKLMHLTLPVAELNQIVLTNPEHYLTSIVRVFILINSFMLLLLGLVTFLVFQDFVPALLIQMAPMLSKLVFKWSLHVSPEPLLISVALALSLLTIFALKDENIVKGNKWFAILYGVVCGFGVATKLTSVGIYLLPIFLLGSLRSVLLYGLASIFFLFIFSLPGLGSFGLVIEQIVNISSAMGHHGHGPQGFVDITAYPKNLIKVSSRPLFFMTFLLGLLCVVILKFWFPKKYDLHTWRALSGLCLAFFAQALIVAKHPSGHYMLPALVLSALGIILIYKLLKDFCILKKKNAKILQRFFYAGLIGVSVSQAIALNKLDTQFVKRNFESIRVTDKEFDKCAKIYVWPASNQRYGLFFGTWNTKGSFSKELAQLFPNKSYMYMINDGYVYDFTGYRKLENVAANFPCIFVRGERPAQSLKSLKKAFSGFQKKDVCQSGSEKFFTWGINCTTY